MAVTEQVAVGTIGTLSPDDAAAGLALSTEAQWNQNEADWLFFLNRARVFGARDRNGRVVASAALLPYSLSDAWISMVLVTASWRRRGLATRLVDTCLDTAGKLGLTCWLDATPAGAAVYGPLGFVPTIETRRLRREAGGASSSNGKLPSGDLDALIARDRQSMGFDRAKLLRELGGRTGSRCVAKDGAMALIRDGRTARHIGPLYANDSARALTLIRDIAAHEREPLLIDAVATHDEFLNGLTGSGWTIERPFQRMRFGQPHTQGTELPFAVAGPEYG
ncbi:MAG: GNAT family N-acetyltransferase [Bradyrhizobium sp.]|uniref:GNAT family N-acetyltransferase n=1 Tax=Bradyrhizobium sp. TaxID=376 RepID=UPI001DD908F2|nr:GNAT family N-acetyltransferase [Bradyrhizobium sp.]MBV9566108.1 GNAT family N-acetyltransferase [Bradyrhizobium sp.]